MNPRFSFTIDLPVRNDWANVDLVRTSILNCFAAVFSDIDGCHAFAMVAGELLENAIKYGDWTDAERPLHLRVWGEKHWANVQVENPVRSDSIAVRDLQEVLARLETYESAEEAYRAKLLEVAAAPREKRVSKLGLARIAYEGNCRLEANIREDVLSVTSHMTF